MTREPTLSSLAITPDRIRRAWQIIDNAARRSSYDWRGVNVLLECQFDEPREALHQSESAAKRDRREM